jgi:hypothetical protein
MKISKGGKIVGIIEIIMAIGLIGIYIIGSGDVRMERFLESPATTLPVLCLVAGLFKLPGVIIIFLKQKWGIAPYAFGSLSLIFLIFTLSLDFQISQSDELLPILILYVGIAIQFWFIYILSKAIQKE